MASTELRKAAAPSDLRGRLAVVTGSTSGIGLALARELVSRGASVVVHGRAQERCELVARQLRTAAAADGQRVWALAADLSDLARVKTLAETLLREQNTIDLLFLNAGMSYAGYKGPSTSESSGLDILYTSNVLAPAMLASMLVPLLERSSLPGRVVFTSSVLEWGGNPDCLARPAAFTRTPKAELAAYADSKLALNVFAAELADRLRQRDSQIRVRVLAPGMVQSNIAVPLDQRTQRISSLDGPPAPEWRRFAPEQGARYTLSAAFVEDDMEHASDASSAQNGTTQHFLASFRVLAPYRTLDFLLRGREPFVLRTAALWVAENLQKLSSAAEDELYLWPAHAACLDAAFRAHLWAAWDAQLPISLLAE
ncbi:Dehydrogenase/reductase SDR family member 13 [Hondaea fermentalgiana]|uniref:Dehydrogenase/reductase SDR family member 13 n=1 Tax=Hondaea fermentalgiana TaxID=2315210 RepID=A0A2R5GN83_9STRA|nr:Dehydrogenase/reductase SDR family member 13 [Hondaea fermentalgiana]|eukprot:GBG32075.1 Dehydrogenase/reductase SDR family member 13 [Hondaea fermentalgiana]